ncbi:hypothetical protein FD951_09235 [Pseudomonas chlororaphis subsp. aurantiaca]|nr:hypothetical protein FD951_09235 [Pseudomonas chlororaphis subsp. aurantiaca]
MHWWEQCTGASVHRFPLLNRRLERAADEPVIPLTNLPAFVLWSELSKTLEHVYKNANKNFF